MFTLYRIVKWRVAEIVSNGISIHTRNAVFEAVSAPEQYCSAPLLEVEQKLQRNLVLVNDLSNQEGALQIA